MLNFENEEAKYYKRFLINFQLSQFLPHFV